MKIVCTAGTGRRAVYNAELMADHYDPPGVVFEPAGEHNHATEYPVAECLAEVGEALVERHETFHPLDAVLDDAEGDSGGANPTPNAGRPGSGDALAGRIESADYHTLQRVGGQLPTVDGGMDSESLRDALFDHDADDVADAFAAVADDESSDESDTDTDSEDT